MREHDHGEDGDYSSGNNSARGSHRRHCWRFEPEASDLKALNYYTDISAYTINTVKGNRQFRLCLLSV